MSYGLAIMLDQGMVFAADTRTNAGVDSVSMFPKMFAFHADEERLVVILTAGNLATTQSVIGILEENARRAMQKSLFSMRSMFEVAELVGSTLREVYARDSQAKEPSETGFSGSFIVGGQICGEQSRLFHVYPAGNFIEATTETPYFQIGETKYGKPIMERCVKADMSLKRAAKLALVSFDSTIRSNISVAPPIDLLLYRHGDFRPALRRRIADGDEYFGDLRQFWGLGLQSLFVEFPDPSWAMEGEDDATAAGGAEVHPLPSET